MRRRALLGLVAAVAWALFGGAGGCGIPWTTNPLVAVEHDEQCPLLELWLHDQAQGTSELVVAGLRAGECVRWAQRDRYQDLFLHCPSTGLSSSLLSTIVAGAQGAERKAACTRVVALPAPPPA